MAADGPAARSAAAQVWPPFVLVTGLLLVGLVADDDGLFAAAGARIVSIPGQGGALFVGAVVAIGAVTAVLNLDTSVALLTPVLVHTARSRRADAAALLYASLLLANAGSLLLPGSNLTNLIVLRGLHLRGTQYLARMWAPALAALAVTAAVVAVVERRSIWARPGVPVPQVQSVRRAPLRSGLGLGAVVVVAALVLLVRAPALPVAAVGVTTAAVHLARRREHPRRAVAMLGIPVLIGLFGVAVALGTLGRTWTGPADLLAHLDLWGTAGVAAVATVLVNNLPAASLLAARPPAHPYALLIGLNLGPNLFVTGSLAWVLWLRSARSAGARPSVVRAARTGAVAVPLSVAAAVAMLVLTGVR